MLDKLFEKGWHIGVKSLRTGNYYLEPCDEKRFNSFVPYGVDPDAYLVGKHHRVVALKTAVFPNEAIGLTDKTCVCVSLKPDEYHCAVYIPSGYTIVGDLSSSVELPIGVLAQREMPLPFQWEFSQVVPRLVCGKPVDVPQACGVILGALLEAGIVAESQQANVAKGLEWYERLTNEFCATASMLTLDELRVRSLVLELHARLVAGGARKEVVSACMKQFADALSVNFDPEFVNYVIYTELQPQKPGSVDVTKLTGKNVKWEEISPNNNAIRDSRVILPGLLVVDAEVTTAMRICSHICRSLGHEKNLWNAFSAPRKPFECYVSLASKQSAMLFAKESGATVFYQRAWMRWSAKDLDSVVRSASNGKNTLLLGAPKAVWKGYVVYDLASIGETTHSLVVLAASDYKDADAIGAQTFSAKYLYAGLYQCLVRTPFAENRFILVDNEDMSKAFVLMANLGDSRFVEQAALCFVLLSSGIREISVAELVNRLGVSRWLAERVARELRENELAEFSNGMIRLTKDAREIAQLVGLPLLNM